MRAHTVSHHGFFIRTLTVLPLTTINDDDSMLCHARLLCALMVYGHCYGWCALTDMLHDKTLPMTRNTTHGSFLLSLSGDKLDYR
uniref:Uncharacterized protein n=1 Tax=Leersia perrieri TaxID=77586 RepID=A0A0D9XYL0_9ORYZ